MINKEDWFMIEAQIEKGVYQKDIAETLGVHPKTVSRALKRRGPPSGKRPSARKSKLDPFKSYLLSYKGKDETVTQSALDVSWIGEMTAKVDALSASLLAALDTDSKLIEAAWRRSPRFYDDNYIDLACFTKNLRKKADAELQAKVVDLIATLKAGKGRAILCQGKIGREVRGTCGLSIYFPGDRINLAYRTLDLSRDCKWIAFLERYRS